MAKILITDYITGLAGPKDTFIDTRNLIENMIVGGHSTALDSHFTSPDFYTFQTLMQVIKLLNKCNFHVLP